MESTQGLRWDVVLAASVAFATTMGMLPSVSFGIALFAIGVWLISTRKR